MCYAQKYANIIQSGDASPLVNLGSGNTRRHAMEALTLFSKYTGSYDKWQEGSVNLRQGYS